MLNNQRVTEGQEILQFWYLWHWSGIYHGLSMDWLFRGNLNRKPSIFPLVLWVFAVKIYHWTNPSRQYKEGWTSVWPLTQLGKGDVLPWIPNLRKEASNVANPILTHSQNHHKWCIMIQWYNIWCMTYLSIYLSVYLSIYQSIYLSNLI